MADYTFNSFPIEADEVDIDQLVTDVSNVQDDMITLTSSVNTLTGTVNGLSTSKLNVSDAKVNNISLPAQLYVQDVPSNPKNVLPNTANTRTINGVTFTVNPDGSISTSGTSTAGSEFIWKFVNEVEDGDYIASGCPSGGSFSTFYVTIWDYTTNARAKAWDGTTESDKDYGSGANVKIIKSHVMAYDILVNPSTNMDGKTFYPMLRLGTDADPTYEPFAKTNIQLSQIPSPLYQKNGKYFFHRGMFSGIGITTEGGYFCINGVAPDVTGISYTGTLRIYYGSTYQDTTSPLTFRYNENGQVALAISPLATSVGAYAVCTFEFRDSTITFT